MKTVQELQYQINELCHQRFKDNLAIDEKFEQKIDTWKQGIILLESGIIEDLVEKQAKLIRMHRTKKTDKDRLEVLDFIFSEKSEEQNQYESTKNFVENRALNSVKINF